MKKLQLLLVAAMLTGVASVASAQDSQQQAGPRRGNMMGALLQGITLSAEQQVTVDSINKKYADQRQSMRSEMQGSDQATRTTKMREMMTKQVDEIKALLTDEQKKVFEKNQTDMQARMQGGGRPPR